MERRQRMGWYFHFMVHGVDVHVQNEPYPTRTELAGDEEESPDLGEIVEFLGPTWEEMLLAPTGRARFVTRSAAGTTIGQDEGKNWFHFAITTPRNLGPHGNPLYMEAFFWGTANEQATVTDAQVWGGGVPNERQLEAGGVRVAAAGDFEVRFSLAGVKTTYPVVISVLVEFEDGGLITFGGAGVTLGANDAGGLDWDEEVEGGHVGGIT
jgi:hypothetical protein